MNNDKAGREYATKDIANIVGIAESTVRKYSQALEKAGYKFIKNENGFRIFMDKDIFAFNEIKSISKKNGMPVEKITEMIVFNLRQETQHESTNDTPKKIQSRSQDLNDIVQSDTRYVELMSKLNQLDDIVMELKEVKETNKLLIEQMMQQQEYINQSLEIRDQRLLESIRSIQEQKQAQIEVAASTPKKGFFSRLFAKK